MLDALYEMKPEIESRWASAENPDAQRGGGGKKRNGRKGAAWFTLEAGQTAVLAHAENTSGMIRRIWATVDNIRTKSSSEVLRGLVRGKTGLQRTDRRFLLPRPRPYGQI